VPTFCRNKINDLQVSGVGIFDTWVGKPPLTNFKMPKFQNRSRVIPISFEPATKHLFGIGASPPYGSIWQHGATYGNVWQHSVSHCTSDRVGKTPPMGQKAPLTFMSWWVGFSPSWGKNTHVFRVFVVFNSLKIISVTYGIDFACLQQ